MPRKPRYTQLPEAERRIERLEEALNLLLDAADWTQNCSPSDMVGAVLPSQLIVKARAALAQTGRDSA